MTEDRKSRITAAGFRSAKAVECCIAERVGAFSAFVAAVTIGDWFGAHCNHRRALGGREAKSWRQARKAVGWVNGIKTGSESRE